MQVLMGNDGKSYRIADINNFPMAGKTYLYEGQSDPIDIGAIWLKVSALGTPTTPMNVLIGDTPPTAEQIHDLKTQYYWLFGDVNHGGLCFCKNGNGVQGWRYSNTTNQIDSYDYLGNSGNLYIYDVFYRNGVVSPDETTYIVINSGSSGRLGGNSIHIDGATITGDTTYKALNSLPDNKLIIQGGWAYISITAPTPNGISENKSTTSQIEILEVSTMVSISPWLEYNLPSRNYFNWYRGVEKVYDNPFKNTSVDDEDGGGDGAIIPSVPINVPTLPTEKAINSGTIKFFIPSDTDLQSFNNWLYSRPDNIITNLKKIWTNPLESIISLGLVPLSLSSTVMQEVMFCGVGTGISMPVLGNQYIQVHCGYPTDGQGHTYTPLPEEYRSFIDYGLFTKTKIFLPFIGIVDLNTDDVIGASVKVDYNINLLSGECIAFVSCTKSRPEKYIGYDAVLYTFNGNVLESMPLTANNYQQLYSSFMNIAQHTAIAVADPVGGAMGIAGDLISPKVNVQRSGSISGNVGSLGGNIPYLIIERPPVSEPDNFPLLHGHVTYRTRKLKECKGYIEVEDGTIRVKDTKATDEELQMIKELLESGVIF